MRNGQFGKNNSEDEFTHFLRVETTTYNGQVGKTSSEDTFTHNLRVEITMYNGHLTRIAQRMN